MKKYKFLLTSEITVTAENVAKALKLAKKIGLVGAHSGARHSKKEPRGERWTVEASKPSIRVAK